MSKELKVFKRLTIYWRRNMYKVAAKDGGFPRSYSFILQNRNAI